MNGGLVELGGEPRVSIVVANDPEAIVHEALNQILGPGDELLAEPHDEQKDGILRVAVDLVLDVDAVDVGAHGAWRAGTDRLGKWRAVRRPRKTLGPERGRISAVIELRNLTKRFESVTAVDRVSFDVAPGELVMLVGNSGSGKTTTLRMVNRLIEPTEGTLRLFGEDARALPDHELRRRIGYVFQKVGLFPHLTVGENVAITPRLLGWDDQRIRAQVDRLLNLVELAPETYRARPPSALSGGQQQRVGVARALAAEPKMMLLDEPFGALDPATRETVQDRFQAVRQELGVGGLFVTHDMAEALMLGDRVGVMRAGRLIQLGTPHELVVDPVDEEVQALVDTPRRHARRLETVLR